MSRFYGVVIQIFFNDHGAPHFHARYAGTTAKIGIREPTLLEGTLPRGTLRFVIEWASLHQQELLDAWERARRGESPGKIAPLG